MTAITAVLNLHREGELARASLASLVSSVEHARGRGLEVEPLVVLDRSDGATRNLVRQWSSPHELTILDVDHGDLAASRNEAVRASDAEAIGFLDGDDLWCRDWLTRSWEFARAAGERTICHPAWNVVFGAESMLFPHPDQTDRWLSLESLRATNYWTALSFARRAIYEAHPFPPNRIEEGFGFEDWAWNLETIRNGYLHRVVPETTHFIRYKEHGSLRGTLKERACLRTPPELTCRTPPTS